MPQATAEKKTRFPALVPLLAATGVLGLFHAAFLIESNLAFASPEMAWGMTQLGMIAAVVTMLVIAPAALLLRRLLPAWRRAERGRATWTAALGLVAAAAAWMVADQVAAGPLVPAALGPWVEAAAVVAAVLASRWLQPPRAWLRAGAAVTVALVVAVFLPIGRHGKDDGDDDAPAPAVAGADRPDVVLVSVDTLRADRLGAYGRSPSITPEMDRVAGEGVVLRRVLAAGPWTVPSVASMLTGLPTERHGAGRPQTAAMTFMRSPLPGEQTTLAERFAAAGYRTRAVVTNGFITPEMGMAQGFEEFVNPLSNAMGGGFMRVFPLGRIVTSLLPPFGDYRAAGVTDQALAWLGEDDGRPLFLWVHYIDPHVPMQADPAKLDVDAWMEMMREKRPEVADDGTVVGDVFFAVSQVRSGQLFLGPEDRRRLTDYYDRAVAYVDEHVGRLFAALRQRGGRPVIAVLTADHGEELWDHGHYEHGHDYYREVTWVPLVFWGPGAVPAGRTVDAVAGLVDVAPTLLALAGLEPPLPAVADEGRPLTSLWTEETLDDAGAATPPRFSGGNLYDLPAVLAEEGPWRFILRANGHQELYDVTRDPRERHNLAFDRPDVAERFRQALEPRLAFFLAHGDEGPREMSPEELEALRSLGYVQ